MTEAFFVAQDDDLFVSTQWTIGPWSTEAQHAGPSAASLGRALERTIDRADTRSLFVAAHR